jgi:hypothetical protein
VGLRKFCAVLFFSCGPVCVPFYEWVKECIFIEHTKQDTGGKEKAFFLLLVFEASGGGLSREKNASCVCLGIVFSVLSKNFSSPPFVGWKEEVELK